MTTATKTFLGISIIGFAAGGIVDFGGFPVNPMFTAIFPVGAIFLGMFLISLILEKEVAKFDEDHARQLALARRHLTAHEKEDL